jgi:ferredoxin-NADP reductase/fatty acid desaturase
MSAIDALDRAPSGPAERHALPDPGESVPKLALPTLGIYFGALTVFVISTVGYVRGLLPIWITIPVNAAVTFWMFTVVHDASHYAISSKRWVNALFGRLAWIFVVPFYAFPAFAYIHIEHHRHSNDDVNDPDTFASHGRLWLLPFRWALAEVFYGSFYLRRVRSRPTTEIAETALMFTASVAGLIVAIITGNLWTLAVVFLIPYHIGLVILAWWFDWLPHHGLEDTQRSNRYRATRARVGMEWLYTPLMLSQNYHLVHHLHPSVPFFRYLRTWRRNEEAYLEREPAISTVFGQQLNPEEFREWKQLNRKLGRLLPVRMPAKSSAPHAVLHRIPVASVDPITADSTLVTFAVPESLRDEFRFEPGQHVTVHTDLGGEGVRRNYSICAPATRAQLRIAVKHIAGGAFSSFVANQLKAGDVLELMTPTGRFGTPLHPLAQNHYVALTAGSGITPVLSILETVMEIETESRFTLIYGNHTKESTMFRHDLDRLETRYADRLEILHVLSGEPLHTPELRGRIDEDKLDRWLTTSLRPDTVDDWFLCGPIGMSTTARDTLIKHGVDSERIHLELFTGYEKVKAPRRGREPATVTFTLSGRQATFDLAPGDSILEGALQLRSDAPYACMGGACGTCRAKLLEGTVEMDQNFALGQAELEAGYILTCQSHPTSSTVSVDYDE